nr:MAG TPA: hypothetical protein [Caudoviricetes sp.]
MKVIIRFLSIITSHIYIISYHITGCSVYLTCYISPRILFIIIDS